MSCACAAGMDISVRHPAITSAPVHICLEIRRKSPRATPYGRFCRRRILLSARRRALNPCPREATNPLCGSGVDRDNPVCVSGRQREKPSWLQAGPTHSFGIRSTRGLSLAMLGSAIGVDILWLLLLVPVGAYFFYSARREEAVMLQLFPEPRRLRHFRSRGGCSGSRLPFRTPMCQDRKHLPGRVLCAAQSYLSPGSPQ